MGDTTQLNHRLAYSNMTTECGSEKPSIAPLTIFSASLPHKGQSSFAPCHKSPLDSPLDVDAGNARLIPKFNGVPQPASRGLAGCHHGSRASQPYGAAETEGTIIFPVEDTGVELAKPSPHLNLHTIAHIPWPNVPSFPTTVWLSDKSNTESSHN